MRHASAADIDSALAFPNLVERLRTAFRDGVNAPVRHHHAIARPEGAGSTLLLMPAWSDFEKTTGNGFIGVKIVTVSPDNNALGKPAVMGLYLLMDGATGEPLALIDGQRLTLWRTAAASALAATYLARDDASRLLMIGAGALAPFLIRAHAAVRPIRDVRIWNRTPENARRAADRLSGDGLGVTPIERLDDHLGWADIVSSATISATPLVEGERLAPGCHVDLVGGFTPTMREADDSAIRRASVYVDVHASATKEAGDIVQPLASGVLSMETIRGDLAGLCSGTAQGRSAPEEITLFKSAGAAIEDLTAGIAVYEALQRASA